jgi:SAM-dependent methyltransferase
MKPDASERFLALLSESIRGGTLVKLTLGKPAYPDSGAVNVFVRPVKLKAGPRLSFVWRHATKDVTKNHTADEAIGILGPLLGRDFLDAHLFTTGLSAQLETGSGKHRIRVREGGREAVPGAAHDRPKGRPIDPSASWLRALGVTDDRGRPLAPMTDKFRQIERFAEILGHLLKECTFRAADRLSVFDMGCGKGYLTFAASELLGESANVCGVEARGDLVHLCSNVAQEERLAHRLTFREGTIASTDIGDADVLVALHACDTATDDALAKAVRAGATLILAAPCCQKELRPQLVAPGVLAPALRHGIFVERQSEFVTDALRAMLLEWSGYRTKVMEFISTEHTAKNTLITAVKVREPGRESDAQAIRDFAAFYGIKSQALARQLGFSLK